MSGTGVSEFFLRDALHEAPHLLLPFVMPALWQSSDEHRPKTISRWREYPTSVGRIDLLLAWPGVIVVVECKKGTATEGAVAQTLRYMGVIGDVGPDGSNLVGVVAAEDFDRLAISAARACGIVLVRLSPAVACSDAFPPKEQIEGHDALKAAASWPLGALELRRTIAARKPAFDVMSPTIRGAVLYPAALIKTVRRRQASA